MIELINSNGFKRVDIIILFLLYQLFWFSEYFDISNKYKVVLVIITLIYQFSSLKRAIAVLLIAIFIPFFDPFIGLGLLRLEKIFSLPFLIKYSNEPKRQSIHITNTMKYAILLILILYLFQILFAVKYPENYGHSFSIINLLSNLYTLFIVLAIFYSIFVKIPQDDFLNYFMAIMIVASLSMASSIIYMIIQNPKELYSGLMTGIMWRNPFFGHKNTWGLYFSLFSLVCYYFLSNNIKNININRKLWLFLFFISILILIFSLSRRAALVFIFGILYLMRRTLGFRTLLLISLVVVGLYAWQPDFLIDRYRAIVEAEKISELRYTATGGQLWDEAIAQFIHRFSWMPRFFTESWEYNIMEGFYGQLLFRMGILGFLTILIFNIVLLIKDDLHFEELYKMIIYYFIFASFGYREAFLTNIYGIFGYSNILISFFVFYNLVIITPRNVNLINSAR